jgi:polysaccharide biosynthesis protein PslG
MTHLWTRFVAAAFIVGLFVATGPQAAVVGPNSQFGFAAGGALQNLGDSELARYLDGAEAAHAGWIRIDVNWNVIQQAGPGSYDWSRFDNVVTAITSRGMRVLAGILYTPPWARAAGTEPATPPSNLDDYAAFVRTTVERYAPRGVHAYEIWNEPNVSDFWAPGPDPARYAQLLRLAYSAVKSVDPKAIVVSGGLAPYGAYGEHSASRMNPLDFLQRMYAHGAAGSFDALGWHPSNYPYGLSFARWSAWSQMSRTTPSARSIMRAHGDTAKQIWPTEFAFPTGRAPAGVDEAVQARLLTRSYAALARWRWAGPAFFYTYRDSGALAFGVVRRDYSAKPAYTAYRRAAAR